jgi:hypothetical protein
MGVPERALLEGHTEVRKMATCSRKPVWGVVLAILLGLALGCAWPGTHITRWQQRNVVQGPGAIFPSVDDAAADALAWCYINEARDRDPGRVRGGTIAPTDGGFTYSEVAAAPRFRKYRVDFKLRPTDVAHFRFYPSDGNPRLDRAKSQHSAEDRSAVDHVDPLHRASYLLTPNRDVVIYAGDGKEWEVGNLADWVEGTRRWGKRPIVRIEDIGD